MAYAERNKVTKKTTGRWIVDAEYKDPAGGTLRWHQAFTGVTKQQAEGNEAYFRATGQKPPHMMEGPTQSFEKVAEKFCERNPKWLKDRINAQRLAFAKTHLGNLDIKAIRTAQLEQYVDTILARCGVGGQPPASNTINNYLSAVGVVLRYAHRLDLIEGVPALPRAKLVGKTRKAVSWQLEASICQKLEASGEHTLAFLVRVLAATGMRRGELYALKPEQIETPERVEHTGWWLALEQTKTNEARWIPFPPEEAKKLRALIASGKVSNPSRLSDKFKEAANLSGESEGITLHSLRHTFATRLEAVDTEALIIAKLLGHSTGLMTSRYFKPSKERLFEVAKKVHRLSGEMPEIGQVVPFQPTEKTG